MHLHFVKKTNDFLLLILVVIHVLQLRQLSLTFLPFRICLRSYCCHNSLTSPLKHLVRTYNRKHVVKGLKLPSCNYRRFGCFQCVVICSNSVVITCLDMLELHDFINKTTWFHLTCNLDILGFILVIENLHMFVVCVFNTVYMLHWSRFTQGNNKITQTYVNVKYRKFLYKNFR